MTKEELLQELMKAKIREARLKRLYSERSTSKHYKYKKTGQPYRTYPNLLLSELDIKGPMQYITSDMTTFYFNGIYYELTLYMDLWNNEIICHSLSTKRGDKRTYISGLRQLLKLKNNIYF